MPILELIKEIFYQMLLPYGGWSAVVIFLSVYLSKITSKRILQDEKHKNEITLSEYQNRIESLEKKQSLNYQQKIELYKVVSEPLASLAALITSVGLTQDHLTEFDRQRLIVTARLALFASQNVFDSYNDLLDYIYNSLENQNYTFPEFREKALKLLSEMRKDIGIYSDNVSYKGSR